MERRERRGKEDLEFSLGLIYGQSSRNFSTKKKKPVKYTTTFLSFFFFSLLSSKLQACLNFLHGEIYCFVACPIARHYLSFSIPWPRLTSLFPPRYDRPVRIESDDLSSECPNWCPSPSLPFEEKWEKIRKSSRKQGNRFSSVRKPARYVADNNAFVKPKCQLTSSIPRIANYRQLTVYTLRTEWNAERVWR